MWLWGNWGNVHEVLGVMFFNGKWTGNEWEMGNVLYIFIGVDLWLIFIFQGSGMGNVPIPVFMYY